MNPPIVIITSLGSYYKNRIIGILNNATATKLAATIIAIVVIFLVFVFI